MPSEERKCVVCSCTESRACVIAGVPCSWADLFPPTCTVCTVKPDFSIGTAVAVKSGAFVGRKGVVRRVHDQFPAFRYVVLQPGPGQTGQYMEFLHIQNLRAEIV